MEGTKKWLLMLTVILVLLVVLVMLLFFYVINQQNAIQKQIVDYYQFKTESLNDDAQSFLSNDDNEEVETPFVSDLEDESETANSAIKQLFVEKYDKNASEVVVNISKLEGNFASGGVILGEGPGNGGYFLATKVNNNWKIVFDGNGAYSCTLLESYGFPQSMKEGCYNN